MSHHHDGSIGGEGEPFTIASILIEADGRMAVEFVTEHPHHRHFNMSFSKGDDATLDKAVIDLAEALVPAAVSAMMDMLAGASSVPATAAELVGTLWYCRICDASAPEHTPGWREVRHVSGSLRRYCPEHEMGDV